MASLQCTKKRNRLSGKFTYTVRNAFALNRTSNQLMLRIPAEILKLSALRFGDRISMTQVGDALVISKLSLSKKRVVRRRVRTRLIQP